MDNKLTIEYEYGAYTWTVSTPQGVRLCSGSSSSRLEAAAAAAAVQWMEGRP